MHDRSNWLGIIWDVDGTLADTSKLGYSSTLQVLQNNKLSAITEEDYHHGTRYATPDRFAWHVTGNPKDPIGIKLGNEFDSLYVDMVSKETAPLFKNIDDLLVELKKKDNICYGALSNACGAYVRAVLEVNEIDQLFNVQLGADEVSAPKPHPDGLLQCCQQLKLPPSQCVYIGDSPTDAEAALSAGMRAIGVTWGSHSADRVLAAFPVVAQTVKELKRKLENIGADTLSCKDDDIV